MINKKIIYISHFISMCFGIALGILLTLWGFYSEFNSQHLVNISILLTVFAVVSRITFFVLLKKKNIIEICKKGS